jgi:hypothetical protein
MKTRRQLEAFTRALREMIQAAKVADDALAKVEGIDAITTVLTGYPQYMPSFNKFMRDISKWEVEASRAVTRQVYSYDRTGVDPQCGSTPDQSPVPVRSGRSGSPWDDQG